LEQRQRELVEYAGALQQLNRSLQERTLAFQESEMKYRSLVETTSDWVWATDDRGVYTYVSPRVQDLLGYEPDEILGKTPFDLMPPDEAEKVADCYRQKMLSRLPFERLENTNLHKSGRRIVLETSAVPVFDAGGRYLGYQGIDRDITGRKQAEREREELITKLETQNAELERFAYTVSHDLKSPLVTIKGFLGLLEQDLADGDAGRLQDDLARISTAADRMHRLLDELLDLSRIGRVVSPAEDVPLRPLIDEVLELMAGQIGRRSVCIDVEPDLPVLHGDRVRLREVLQNLIENAVKNMGDQPSPRIEIGARQTADETTCYVRDNGIGIDPRYHQQIFGLFDKLDPSTEGTGVGLAVVKRAIEVHSGRIWVESQGANRGSTFYFCLPRKPPRSKPSPARHPSPPDRQR
jgi:PAS domain S-box-containing protein